MTAVLNFLRHITDQIFESQMRRAANRITVRQQLFPHHAT